jgi:hypothetical protein
MLDDPGVNFAISTRGRQPDHLGIQAESIDELGDIYARLQRAGGSVNRTGGDPLSPRSA